MLGFVPNFFPKVIIFHALKQKVFLKNMINTIINKNNQRYDKFLIKYIYIPYLHKINYFHFHLNKSDIGTGNNKPK